MQRCQLRRPTLCRYVAVAIYLSFAIAAFAAVPQHTIRVRVLRSQRNIQIDGFGLTVNGHSIARTLLPIHSRVRVERQNGYWVVSVTQNRFRTGIRTLVISGEMLKFDGQLQPPAVILLEGQTNSFDVVENMPIEEYLQGVLPNEMPIHWPIAALEAQTVASNSYAQAQAMARANEGFDVDNTIESQVFNWQTYAHMTGEARRKLTRILFETRGGLLVGHNGKPYLAYFHSDCGGVTELPQNVWGSAVAQEPGHIPSNAAKNWPGHVTVVHDSYCLLNRHNRWDLHLTLADLQSLVRMRQPKFRGSVREIKIVSYSPSGRADQMLIASDHGSLAMSGQDFRRMIGYARMKSTLFAIKRVADGFEFSGRGFGHGVGLCQHGARFMAMNGSNYRQILKHYYPQARLINTERMPLRAPMSSTVIAQSE